VAVVVADSTGRAVAALSATLPRDADRATVASIAQQLTRAAGVAGRTLGNA
jgi:DNA-binding IclR family transcriptional regulator